MSITEFLKPDAWLGQTSGPRYVQLRRRLEAGINDGILLPNTSLPPERELAQLTDLSRVTVRKAIQELAEKGLIEPRQGSGSFVRDTGSRVEQSLSRLTSFSEDMKRRGMVTKATWLERGIFIPSPEEMVALGLRSGDSVSRIFRIREAGGRPLALERASLPVDVLPDPMSVTTSLYAVLEASDMRPVRAVQKIAAVNLSTDDAAMLGVAEGAAGLSIQRSSYLEGGRMIEFTRSLYRGDAYDFVAELRLAPGQD